MQAKTDGSTLCISFSHRRALCNAAWQVCPKKGGRKTLDIILVICTTLNLSLLCPLKTSCRRYRYELNTELISFWKERSPWNTELSKQLKYTSRVSNDTTIKRKFKTTSFENKKPCNRITTHWSRWVNANPDSESCLSASYFWDRSPKIPLIPLWESPGARHCSHI